MQVLFLSVHKLVCKTTKVRDPQTGPKLKPQYAPLNYHLAFNSSVGMAVRGLGIDQRIPIMRIITLQSVYTKPRHSKALPTAESTAGHFAA